MTDRFVVSEETIRDWILRQRIEVLIVESESGTGPFLSVDCRDTLPRRNRSGKNRKSRIGIQDEL